MVWTVNNRSEMIEAAKVSYIYTNYELFYE